MIDPSETLLVFLLDGQRFAIGVQHVQRVIAAAEVTPLAGADGHVAGVIDLHGEVVPVLDLRLRPRGSPQRAVAVDDRFIVVTTSRRTVVLVADSAQDLLELPAGTLAALPQPGDGRPRFHGATRQHDGLVLVHDVEQFLDARQTDALEHALEALA